MTGEIKNDLPVVGQILIVFGLIALGVIRLVIAVAAHGWPSWWEIPIAIGIAAGVWFVWARFLGPLVSAIFTSIREEAKR